MSWLLVAWALQGAVAGEEPHVPEDGSASPRWHVRLDATATWGIGGQMFLGVDLHPSAYRTVWTAPGATGTVDLGFDLHYGNEAGFLAPWVDTEKVSGANHRVQALATAGGTFHLTARRRFGLGMHLLAGLNQWVSAYTVDYAAEDFSDRAVVQQASFLAGGRLTFSYRVHRHVGVTVIATGFLPTESSYAISFGHVGLGLTFYLR